MQENTFRALSAAMSAAVLLSLSACGGGSGGGVASEPEIPPSHTIQVSTAKGPSVSGPRNENGTLAAIVVGENQISRAQEISLVSGGGGRGVVGPVAYNENVIVRHISRHWNMQTDTVTRFDYISYGAWATGMVEFAMDGSVDNYNYVGVGDAYLTARDDARTPAAGMPVSGTASYLGQATGFVQGHGVGGRIAHFTADVEMTADFANAAMTMDMLTTRGTRVVLGGAIHGNGFSGSTILQMPQSSLIEVQGATAQMAGGFYGADAVEAGGVFEIVGGRAQDPGRLVGAFGGRKDE